MEVFLSVLLVVGLLWSLLGSVGFLFNYALWKKQHSEVSMTKNVFFFFWHGPVLWLGGILFALFLVYFACGAYILIGESKENEDNKEKQDETGT